MAHLSPQLQHRFLARLLTPEETLAVIQHLRECDACRESLSVLRSNKPGSLLDTILPEIPAEEHPSADALAAYLDDDQHRLDKTDVEEHLRTCELCQGALADLRSFREELLQAPRREYTIGISSRSSPSGTSESRSRSGFLGDKWRFITWFNQPLVFAGVAAIAVLIAVLGIAVVRSPATFGLAGAGSGSGVTVTDGAHRTLFGPNGIINASVAIPKDELAALNGLTIPVLRDEPPALSPGVKDTLTSLKRAPSVLLGQPSRAVPFQVLTPVRTLVQSVRPKFKWTTAAGATNYTVHVIADDRTQEEIATSPTVSPSTPGAPDCEWTLSTSLMPGNHYRWYVSASTQDQEIDAPGIEQAQAKFAVLTEAELKQLEILKQKDQGDRVIDGLLDLNAGLLDDAQNDFESLLADPGQTSGAKDFLNRMIAEIKRFKER
jgi:hypothetical protein